MSLMSNSLAINKSMAGPLDRLLQHADLAHFAANAFTDWPSLREVTTRFLYFVSPWLMIGQQNLAETTLRSAFESYERMLPEGYEASHRHFIERIAESANLLASQRVSVMGADGLWIVWMYDEPLMAFLQRHKRSSMQIRERETSVAAGPVMIKLLASISSTKDMHFAEIDISRLLNKQMTGPKS